MSLRSGLHFGAQPGPLEPPAARGYSTPRTGDIGLATWAFHRGRRYRRTQDWYEPSIRLGFNWLGCAAMPDHGNDEFVTGRLHCIATNASVCRLEPGTGK
jgi:hypothetical protein